LSNNRSNQYVNREMIDGISIGDSRLLIKTTLEKIIIQPKYSD